MTHDHKSDSETADNGGNAVFLQLQQGDGLYVELAENCHVWASPYQTSFSGFLVSQMWQTDALYIYPLLLEDECNVLRSLDKGIC